MAANDAPGDQFPVPFPVLAAAKAVPQLGLEAW
jgi:hypothetical protein